MARKTFRSRGNVSVKEWDAKNREKELEDRVKYLTSTRSVWVKSPDGRPRWSASYREISLVVFLEGEQFRYRLKYNRQHITSDLLYKTEKIAMKTAMDVAKRIGDRI